MVTRRNSIRQALQHRPLLTSVPHYLLKKRNVSVEKNLIANTMCGCKTDKNLIEYCDKEGEKEQEKEKERGIFLLAARVAVHSFSFALSID